MYKMYKNFGEFWRITEYSPQFCHIHEIYVDLKKKIIEMMQSLLKVQCAATPHTTLHTMHHARGGGGGGGG